MDVKEKNRLLSAGRIDREDLWPRITEYEQRARTFRFSFGLDELPRQPGVILVRGPRQYGKSTWLELLLVVGSNEFRAQSVRGITMEQFLLADGFPHPYPGEVDDIDAYNDFARF